MLENSQWRRLIFAVGYSKLEMNTPGVWQHAFSYDDAGRSILSAECAPTCCAAGRKRIQVKF